MKKLVFILSMFLGVLVLNGCSRGYHTSAHVENYPRRVPAYDYYYYGNPVYPGYYYGPSIHYDLGHDGWAGGHHGGHHGH
ncbi:MAG: hypothetical protein K2X86_06015 [Cytophagaceae bacterium]|nr:hypothetical protein [Cytophagaceae bacterium]